MSIEKAAQAAHDLNRIYCQAIGDNTQLPWDQAPQWQRDSAVNGVRAIVADPTISPEASHKSWYDEKEAAGWIHGMVKDVNEKTHPCMVPYDFLPEEQKAKDAIFGATVRGVLAHYAKT
uniref:Putative ryanodine receptor, RyR, domain containing protein n=1 Tax=viral metagenome TaxID=1070528 RepID=A0A6H1ZBF5_9ZZZZ